MKHDLGKTPDVDPSSKKKNRGFVCKLHFQDLHFEEIRLLTRISVCNALSSVTGRAPHGRKVQEGGTANFRRKIRSGLLPEFRRQEKVRVFDRLLRPAAIVREPHGSTPVGRPDGGSRAKGGWFPWLKCIGASMFFWSTKMLGEWTFALVLVHS